jgi:uncharacterized protein (TIGR03437 family)
VIKAFILTAAVIVFFVPHLPAQPTVASGGVLNVASYSYPPLPGGSIAQGSMFTVFGGNMGTTFTGSLSFPLKTSMLNTSIKVTSGTTSVDALMIFTSAGQVTAILPSNTPVGSATLTLTFNGQTSSPVPIQIVPSSFGAFTLNQAGSGPGIIQEFGGTEAVPPVNSIVSPSYPGQTVALWGTGLGPITGDDAEAPVQVNMQTAFDVQVWVGNKQATVTYAGRSSCCAAVDVVYFVVPAGVQGCYVPVVVKAGKAGVVGNVTSMAVAPNSGGACSDGDGIDPADVKTLQSSGSVRLGAVSLTRIEINAAALGETISAVSDSANSVFGRYSPAQLSASLGLTQSPSVGYCTVSQFLGLNPLPVDPIKPTPLDAGASLSITGPAGTKAIPSSSTGVYSATLGGVELDQILTGTPGPPFLLPGSYTISGSGGSAVGSFSQQFTIPNDVTWTNSTISTIDRSKDLTITWTGGGSNDYVVITGLGVTATGPLGPSTTSPGNLFLCVVPAGEGTFTVPSIVLQALPTSAASAIPTSFLLVGTELQPVKFNASGLDDGYVTYRSLTGNNVTIQ